MVYWINRYRHASAPIYIERTLVDKETGVTVHGELIHRDAWLDVVDLTALLEEALEKLVGEETRAALESKAAVAAYRVALRVASGVPAWLGSVDVSLPVDEVYEGMPLLVLGFFPSGDVALYGGIVEDGFLTFETEQLGDFVVLDPTLYEDVFALIHGTFNYALHERIIVSDEALRILEDAYAAYREQLAAEMRASGEYPDLPEQLYLLNADFGIELTMTKGCRCGRKHLPWPAPGGGASAGRGGRGIG